MTQTISAVGTPPSHIWPTTAVVALGPITVTALDPTTAPASYEADETLLLDPQLMIVGQRYSVRIGGKEWWAVKRDPDRLDFRRK